MLIIPIARQMEEEKSILKESGRLYKSQIKGEKIIFEGLLKIKGGFPCGDKIGLSQLSVLGIVYN